jgi:hypothetical protein
MPIDAALFVVGELPGTKTYDDVTEVIKWHLLRKRVYSSSPLRGLSRGMPIFARVVRTGELCLAGRCVSDVEEVAYRGREDKWPFSYGVEFSHVLRHVRTRDVLGSVAFAHKVSGLRDGQFERAAEAFERAPSAKAWLRNPA